MPLKVPHKLFAENLSPKTNYRQTVVRTKPMAISKEAKERVDKSFILIFLSLGPQLGRHLLTVGRGGGGLVVSIHTFNSVNPNSN